MFSRGVMIASVFLKEHVLILTHYTGPFTARQRKRKLQKSWKLLFIFLEALRDLSVTTIEAASQLSSGTRAKLHKVEAAEEDLLLGESADVAF